MAFALAVSGRANSFTIVPTFDSSITSDPAAAQIEATINSAIQAYETVFNNPITVNITFAEMTSGLGQSSFDLYQIPYSTFYTALGNETPSALDQIALANLPYSGPNSLNPVTETPDMMIKPADAAALGIDLGLPAGTSDGTVSINTSLTSPGSNGTSGTYSLLSVTEHEIDEILGLGSTLGLTLAGNKSNGTPRMPLPEDLYRYAANGQRSFTLSASAQAFFSVDGTHQLVQFNNTGSGDYGDWASSGTAQVQDAFGTPGATPTLGANEIAALNVIGYSVVVPEPSTWWLFGAGMAIVGWRRSRVPRA